MSYPLISEYVESIKSAEDNFGELGYLRPVLGDDGLPVMTSGNLAVVFKMKDEQSGKFYAVKCFTKEQEGRAEAYREIAKELENVSSPYILTVRYLEKELFVDSHQTSETEFPVLLMNWVEGKTLDNYLRENLDDKYALEMLAYRFSQLAQWLIPQPFAHGDLKPDNILVREDGSLVLVDYDGMYVPAMKGQKARELGSPDFRHPLRTENDFDEHVDAFPLLSILLSLKLITLEPSSFNIYGSKDRLLLSQKDYLDISKCDLLLSRFPSKNADFNRIVSVFTIILSDYKFVSLLEESEMCHLIAGSLKYFYDLGEKYKNGIYEKQDVLVSFQFFKKAAELGYVKAQYALGGCYRDGFGVEQDFQKALYWYETAAKHGDIRALYQIGYLYEELNDPRASQMYKEAVEESQKLITVADETNAYAVLAICSMRGKGILKDEKKGVELLRKAALKGYPNAQAKLGSCYYKGFMCETNIENAVKWFRRAAYNGDPQGQYRLGVYLLLDAKGIKQNMADGINWIKKAAIQEYVLSQVVLGICYLNGDGVKQDYDIAFYWFAKAAIKGNKSGMYRLGLCYEQGYGTKQNSEEARYWYEKAAEKGEQDALKALDRFKTGDLSF